MTERFVSRVLLLTAALLWVRMVVELARLPAIAVSHGIEGGTRWPGLSAALLVGTAIGGFLYAVAVYRGRGGVPAGTPLLAALTLVGARTIAHGTGPEDLYLVQDGKLWSVFVAANLLLSLALSVVWARGANRGGRPVVGAR